jgi:hypothetical protein
LRQRQLCRDHILCSLEITSPRQYWDLLGLLLRVFSYRRELRNGGQFEEKTNYDGTFSFFDSK